MTKQILFIHGAGNQRHPEGSDKLVTYLQEQLGSNYEVQAPDMPDPDHPRYLAWRDQIARELDAPGDEIILIGHSVGGSVLVKALAEGIPGKKPLPGCFLSLHPTGAKMRIGPSKSSHSRRILQPGYRRSGPSSSITAATTRSCPLPILSTGKKNFHRQLSACSRAPSILSSLVCLNLSMTVSTWHL